MHLIRVGSSLVDCQLRKGKRQKFQCSLWEAILVYDILHPGELRCLHETKLGQILELETIGINGDQAIQNFHDAVRKTNGRYEVTWQWKEANPRLPDNYQLALGRLNSLLKRIQGKLELLQKYDSIIKDQLKKNH